MHFLAKLWPTLLAGALVTARLPSASKRNNDKATATTGISPFIVETGGKLMLNGSAYPYLAMDAYWLSTLVEEQDMANILANISKLGVTNVVVPAYNLVNEFNVPTEGSNATWLQLLHPNASLTFNEGENGFKRLDTLVKQAGLNKIHIDFTLSNNFDPRAVVANQSIANVSDLIINGFNTTRPRNYLRNDFGGADFISATLGSTSHDFFSNQTIIGVYQALVDDIVRRYANEPAVGSWTPIKEAQCSGTLPSDLNCNTTVISQWHNNITEFIQKVDKNHLVIAGTSGFECDSDNSCPKTFTPTTPPPPQTSSTPGRRAVRTKKQILQDRKERLKKARALELTRAPTTSGVKIRGRWVSSRQFSNNVVPEVTNGSSGVDSVDLGNSAVGGLTSSYLPFERTYFTNQNNSDVNNIIELGNEWIKRQADIRDQLASPKPVYLTMGIPVQKFSDFFVFANSSINVVNQTDVFSLTRRQDDTSGNENVVGVSSDDQATIWTSWFSTAQDSNVNVVMQGAGDNEISNTPGTSYTTDTTGTTSTTDSTGTTSSPNDGYNIVTSDDSDANMQSVISGAANSLQLSLV